MRQAVAALVSARALTSRHETTSREPALPNDERVNPVVHRRRRMSWAWIASVWKTTHAS
jgi:hypothetical protein